MSEKIFIIAGSHQEFDNWRKFNHNPVSRWYQNIIYVDDVSRLKGYHQPRGRFIGTWYLRPDIVGIIFQLMVAGSLDREQRDRLQAIREKHVPSSSV